MTFKSFMFAGRMDHMLLDEHAWAEAYWGGVAYGTPKDPSVNPVMGLLFQDAAAGRKVFADLVAKVGATDPNKRVRVSIVEGDLPQCGGQGHTVTLGPQVNFSAKFTNPPGATPLKMVVQWYRVSVRMAHHHGLPAFREACTRADRVVLFPLGRHEQIPAEFPLSLTIDPPVFRQVSEVVVGESDPDEVVVRSGPRE